MDARSKEQRIDLRVSEEHKKLIEEAAASKGQTVTGFAVALLVEESMRVVKERDALRLSNRDRDLFLTVLDNDAVNESLARAAEDFLATYGGAD